MLESMYEAISFKDLAINVSWLPSYVLTSTFPFTYCLMKKKYIFIDYLLVSSSLTNLSLP